MPTALRGHGWAGPRPTQSRGHGSRSTPNATTTRKGRAGVPDTITQHAAEADRALSADQLRDFLVTMLRIRRFEERVAELVEDGTVKTPTHLCIGQEAVSAGVCAAVRRDDYALGNHRSHGHYLAKGGDLKALLAEILGKATGCALGRGGSMHLIAPEVGLVGTVPIVAGTVPIAVGAALASKLRGEGRVALAFFGDGALEEGSVHEAMNLAAV